MEIFANITDFFVKLSMLFLVLLGINHFLYLRFYRKILPDMQSSSIVMAITMFIIACLPQLKVPYMTLTVLSLELAIIWVYFLISYAQTVEKKPEIAYQQSSQLYFGCWISATSMLAILLDQVQPLLHGAILLLLFASVIAWLGYLGLITIKLFRCVFCKRPALLVLDCQMFALSTMTMLVLLYELFSDLPGHYYSLLLAGLAVIFFIVAFTMTIKRAWKQGDVKGFSFHRLDVLFYGILSLIGYYFVETGLLADGLLESIWWLTIGMLVLIDGHRFWFFIRQHSFSAFKKTGLMYHRDHWLHLFSLSSLYWFALSYYYQYSSDSYFVYFIVLLMPYFLLIYMLYQLAANFKYVLSHASRL